MKTRFFLNLSLLAVLLTSCAPAATPAAQPLTVAPSVTSNSQPDVALVSTATPLTVSDSTQASAPTALPIATSRGPNLEATDPTTVNLANGGIQLVEFFRFT